MVARCVCATLTMFLLLAVARRGECLDNGVGLTPASAFFSLLDYSTVYSRSCRIQKKRVERYM